jgi:alkylation response protein AidB-like acyl-CoA dehydrogenase
MMEEVAHVGGVFTAAQAVHGGIYNSVPLLVRYGSEALKRELLPGVASGETAVQAFGLMEPNAGSNATTVETTTERDGDEWLIDGGRSGPAGVVPSGARSSRLFPAPPSPESCRTAPRPASIRRRDSA